MKIGKLTDELKAQIIELNDLREVAEEYGITFNSTGKSTCPFHNDGKNGNLHLHEKRGEASTYYCYTETCSAGTMWEDKKKTVRHILTLPDGTEIEDGGPGVIGFVMNMERCSYIEACVILLGRAGLPIPEGKVDYKEERHKKKTTKLNIEYCQTLFKTPEVMSYLKERRITKASIKKWRLGYIKEDDTSAPMGDKVSGRLVFGLKEETYDTKGAKTVAMAYRTLKDEQPKYYNDYTIEGMYEKKFYLYGINEARQAIKRAGYAVITEGYTDVIIGHQSGIENTVATCGTAFTMEQMEKLRRLTKNLVFWYDGDSPGWNAMVNNMSELLAMGFRIRIMVAPGKDPAEWMNFLNQDEERIRNFIKKNARPALQVVAEQVIDAYEYERRILMSQVDSQLMELKTEALDELLPILNSIVDPSQKMVFESLINSKLG